jgi:hypothetical protein
LWKGFGNFLVLFLSGVLLHNNVPFCWDQHAQTSLDTLKCTFVGWDICNKTDRDSKEVVTLVLLFIIVKGVVKRKKIKEVI